MSDGGLRKIFRSHLPGAFWTSVETWTTEPGVPDSHYLFPGGDSGWIEHKKHPLRFRKEQPAWLSRYARNGGLCFVALRRGGVLTLYQGADALALARAGGVQSVAPIGTWTGGPARWDWGAIQRLITRPPSP